MNTTPVVAIIKINPTTGDRTTVSSSAASVGTGPSFVSPSGIAIGSDGKLIVTDTGGTNGTAGSDSVFIVDPTTGNRTIIPTILFRIQLTHLQLPLQSLLTAHWASWSLTPPVPTQS